MKLNKFLIALPLATLLLAGCNGSSSGGSDNGSDGSGSDTNSMVHSLPLGACAQQGVGDGDAPGFIPGAESQVFNYGHGSNPQYFNDQVFIFMNYSAFDNTGAALVQLGSIPQTESSPLAPPAGYCAILTMQDGEGTYTALQHSTVGLTNCGYTMSGDVMNFTAKYKISNSPDHNLDKSGDFKFSCKLEYRDGHFPSGGQ